MYYLNLAIVHYENGMILDLNDYFPSCNLPRLYRTRNEEGDEDRARNAAVIALTACERSQKRNPDDPWIKPTQIGAAFDTGNIADAQKLLKEIPKGRPADWKIETTLSDLKTSISLIHNPDTKKELELVIDELKKLIGVGE